MDCSRCGSANEPGNAFCSKCGAPLAQAAPQQTEYGQQPQACGSQWYAQQGLQGYAPAMPAPQKKKRIGLMVGLIAGGVALIGAAVAVYFLFLSGPNLKGVWVCEDRGWALQFEDRSVLEYSLTGTNMTGYEYQNGQGTAALSDGDVSFEVKGDRMELVDEETDDRYLFTRQDENIDIKEVALAGFEGLWSSQKLGEVVELDRNGRVTVYSGGGELDGSFDFDLRSGMGTITVGDDIYAFSADWDTLSVETVGDYMRSEENMDVAAFVRQYANPLLGTWYETTGQYGSITFADDGTFSLELYGQKLTGEYTFDAASGTGSVTSDNTGETTDMTYADGTLTLDGMTYTQDYMAQPGADDVYSEVAGAWYAASDPDTSITFNTDGTADLYSDGQSFSGTFTFNPLDLTGVLTLTEDAGATDYNFNVTDGVLYFDDFAYTREQPGTTEPTNTILGKWYDMTGTIGTLYFDKDGLVIMESYGVMFSGTYTFNESAGSGTMTVQYANGPADIGLYLFEGVLYTDEATYTQNYVEQAN
jgi:hypothetical protein